MATRLQRSLRFLSASTLIVIAGCSAVHQREALYPNGQGKVVEGRKGFLRGAGARAARVNLGVEPSRRRRRNVTDRRASRRSLLPLPAG